MLNEGLYASITEMAEAERLDRGYMGRLLQLTLLAPDFVETVVDGGGRVPDLSRLMAAFPPEWREQRTALRAPVPPCAEGGSVYREGKNRLT
jgi:hypothetical protein